MKSILIAGLVALAAPAFAQENANQKAIEHQKTLGYFGYFGFNIGENRTINVNYSFEPRIPTSEVKFMLHTPTSRPLYFIIVDETGAAVTQFKPEKSSDKHEGVLDVNALSSGDYEYHIYVDNKLAHKIRFTKK